MDPLLCPWDAPTFLVFSENIPPLLYYSHFLAIATALLVGIYAFVKGRQLQSSQLLFSLFVLFSLWGALDVIIWATNRADMVVFLWSLVILIEPMIYVVGFYLLYVFIYQRYPGFKLDAAVGALLLPLIILLPTSANLVGINLFDCVVEEGPLALYYTYFLEILFIVGIVLIAFNGMRTARDRIGKIKIAYFLAGIIAFLLAFTSGNIIGSITENWELAQYGLFGMPLFIAVLAYLIVNYKIFSLKVFGAQALVLALWILIGSLLFVVQSDLSRIVSLLTLAIVVGFGFMLIRSVKKEIEQRERIELLAKELAQTNEQQEGLIHFIGHEVKGFLTKDAGSFASLSEGDYGPLPDRMKSFVSGALVQARLGVDSVSNILKAANLKKGTVEYVKEPFDLKILTKDAVERSRVAAEHKGLALSFTADEGDYQMTGDKGQISDHVLRNLIDNAINYTPSGSIAVSLRKEADKLVFSVKDTGVGITDEDKKRLFTEGGHGKDSQSVNVHSTGYGLYIAKQITEAHGGTIRAESEGEGKGSTFTVELPA